jgi:enoyl-CoA hydratase/carnithine racemase
VPHEAIDAATAELVGAGKVSGRRPHTLPASHVHLAGFFDSHDVEQIRIGQADTRGDDQLSAAMKAVGTKAPVAVRLAATLIDQGAAVSLEDGLRMELGHLTEIFSTKDALAGLLSVGKSRAVFEGR